MPDCKGYREAVITEQTLLPSKWNKDSNNTWQLKIGLDNDGNDSDSDSAWVNKQFNTKGLNPA